MTYKEAKDFVAKMNSLSVPAMEKIELTYPTEQQQCERRMLWWKNRSDAVRQKFVTDKVDFQELAKPQEAENDLLRTLAIFHKHFFIETFKHQFHKDLPYENSEVPTFIESCLSKHQQSLRKAPAQKMQQLVISEEWEYQNDWDPLRAARVLAVMEMIEWLEEEYRIFFDGPDFEVQSPQASMQTSKQINRPRWKANTAALGYLMLQLVEQDFIELPKRKGDLNFSSLAEALKAGFEILNADGTGEVSDEYLAKQCRESSNALSDSNRAKFRIPNRRDIS